MRTAIARWLIAVMLTLLVMCPHFRMYSSEHTRYFAFWDLSDAIAIQLIVFASGTALFACHELIRRRPSPWLKSASKIGFVLLFGMALLSNLDIAQKGYMQLSWSAPCYALTVIVIVAAMLGGSQRFKWIPRFCATACLILSPVIPLLFVQMLMYSTYPVRLESLSEIADAPPSDETQGDVYVFVFDAWSYEQSLGRSDLKTDLPNLAEFASIATVYHNAHSLFTETYQSLPSIIFQTDAKYVSMDGGVFFRNGGDDVSKPSVVSKPSMESSLFGRPIRNSYQTFMVGWSHPYRPMLGEAVDFVYSAPSQGSNPNASRIDQSIARHLQMGLANFALSIPKPLKLQWPLNAMFDLHDGAETAVARANSIHSLATSIASRDGGPRVAVLHYPVPHGPFVFDRNGYDPNLPAKFPLKNTSAHAGLQRPDPQNHIARYRGNMRYMDTLLGDFIRTLKDAGRYDNATIVLTADHSWRVDPAFDQLCLEHKMTLGGIVKVEPPLPQLTHVPLLVKAPHQSENVDILEPIQLTQLGEIINLSQQTTTDAPSLALQGRQALPADSTP
ncbi:MAG: hypothetical protein DHS20C16_06670 [Phycisphaerae bacterium]|nr:MAG: hypothetical protein DHS20C16_06670 [Phycisphaerae bacterium]